MSNELERWANGSPSLIPSKGERQHNKAVANPVRETKFAGLKVDAEAALAGRMMERTCDLDKYRRALAGSDEALTDTNYNLIRDEFKARSVAIREQVTQFADSLAR